jgi:hypothetical protein
MLEKWLACEERVPCPFSQFNVIDIVPIDELPPEICSHLLELLQGELFNPDLIKDASKYLGSSKVKDLIGSKIPASSNFKKGDFGEMLINAILEQFHGYEIPIRKLRYTIRSDESPHGIDSLAFKAKRNGIICEVCYIESKFRASRDTSAAIDAYEQLKNDYDSKLPAILQFILNRLYELNNPLSVPFLLYLRDRGDTSGFDTFRISLCWENDVWDETTLENLEEYGSSLPNLEVHVIRIDGVSSIVEMTFSKLGLTEVFDEDN